MYQKDKTKKIVVRVNKKQYDYLTEISKIMNTTKSEIVRGYINKLMGNNYLANN